MQPPGEPDLSFEPAGTEDRSELRVQDFHGDRAIVPEILSEKDRRHRPVAQLPLDGVPPG